MKPSKTGWALAAAAALGLGGAGWGLRAGLSGPASEAAAFGRLPVLHQGRVKPLDSVARASLLMISGKQSIRHEGRRLDAAEWLLDVLARAEAADFYKIFRIDDSEVRALAGLGETAERYFSFKDLEPSLEELEKQSSSAEALEAARRSRFERAVVNLSERVILYQRLKNTLAPAGTDDLPREIEEYARALEKGRGAFNELHRHIINWDLIQRASAFSPLAPLQGAAPDEWSSLGQGLIESARSREVHPGIKAYARLARAWRTSDAPVFDKARESYEGWIRSSRPSLARWVSSEAAFNRLRPFVLGMSLYLGAGLLVFASWLWRSLRLERAAFAVLAAGFAVHTLGLGARMLIEGRPPVTNLYSSAVFVGWMSALLGVVMERRCRGGLGSLTASMAGFATLLVAHHLSVSGDTMEMMRAVLDSNFWLATHVVAITVGYAAAYVAGLLAHVYILRGALTATLDRDTAAKLSRMTYGTICFCLFFSFVGTVLGGIWADQSWGRFWGWDPKENGALLIVLWQAIILHARWGGYARERGIMVMAVIGNIITSLSWFGVNMLGIGLHSYGFMDTAFFALAGFIAFELVVIAVGLLPPGRWRSRWA